MPAAPVHHEPKPEPWVVWYGGGTFAGQLGMTLTGIPGVPALAFPISDIYQAAFRALPLSAIGAAGIVVGDPYYVIQTTAPGGGPFVSVVQNCSNATQALQDANTIAAARQFGIENAIYGDWIQTIRPKLSSDDDSDTAHGPDGTTYKLAVLQLTDGRFYMSADHHWHNRNHPGVDLGWALAPCDPPSHGVSGVIKDLGSILSAAWKDCLKNPLGAALLLLVLISAAPAAPLFAGGAQVVVAVSAVTDATGVTHGALSGEAAAAKWAAEHPSEVGEIAASVELMVAGAAVGGKLGSKLTGLGGNLLGKGLADTIGAPDVSGIPNPVNPGQDQLQGLQDTPPKRRLWFDWYSQ